MRLFEATDLPLHEAIYEFLRLNRLTESKGDFSRQFLGRSRTYLNTLSYNGHSPSNAATTVLRQQLKELLDQPLKPTTKEVIEGYIQQLDECLKDSGTEQVGCTGSPPE